jgi:hypothetical protein
MTTPFITDELIKTNHKEMWDKALAEHGNPFSVPQETSSRINETLRALYTLQVWQRSGSTGNPAKFLSSYSIYPDVLMEVVRDYCSIEIDSMEEVVVKAEKRSDKYDAFIDWSKAHLFEQYTTEQLVEISGFSYPTTLKFIQDSPVFRKIKKGLWEIRDPKADRQAEQ